MGWKKRLAGMDLGALAGLALAAPALAQGSSGLTSPSSPLLNPLFQDHAVLQRDKPISVWGYATPGDSVSISLGGARATARADRNGHWRARLPGQHAGGPFTLSARASSGATQSASDVMIGDVWLCAGQSNMVLQVHRALDSRAEIQNSANDQLRLMTIALRTSATPLERFPAPVEWQVAAPATVPEWSAACYYFARELRKTVTVPMGMVVAAWGGANIRPWMSASALRAAGYGEGLDLLALNGRDPAAALQSWGAHWETWWKAKNAPGDEPWAERAPSGDWRAAPSALGYWETWGVPELAEFNGLVWYRTSVRLTEAQARQNATLSLGAIDEIDMSWVNGRSTGYTSDAGAQRTYVVPQGVLHAGENVIAVNALDTYATGGLYGPAETRALRLADGASIPLTGWRYRIVPNAIGRPARAPWDATGGLSVIRNAMIAPLGDFGFRGAVWYQGESNTEEPDGYQALLAGLMADWRGQFGAGLPFLIVQLAGYGAPSTQPANSGTAALREAQRQAVLHDPHAGLAVAVDIGERLDIHPPNKQELGRRLARAARHVIYGEPIIGSGPVPLSATRNGGAVVIRFGDVEQHLVAYSAENPIGFESCDANSCRFASARIEDNRVLLAAANAAAATRVRYCWADHPVCTLYDANGAPAGPFEIPIQ